jgi:hypothetical protein
VKDASIVMQPWLVLVLSILAGGANANAEEGASRTTLPPQIESLARELRIEIYNTFRLERAELDRRRATAAGAVSAWMAAGARAEDTAQLAAWLRAARAASITGSVRPLPAVPAFGYAPPAAERHMTPPLEPPRTVVRPPDSHLPPTKPPASAPPVTSRRPSAASVLVQRPNALPAVEAEPAPATPSRGAAATLANNRATAVDQPPIAPPARRPAPKPVDPDEEDRVEVNLVELEARIAGYNRSLAMLENRLLVDRVRSAEEVTEMIDSLAALASRRADVEIYLNLLDPTERRRMKPPARIASASDLLRQAIAANREQAGVELRKAPGELRDRLRSLDALERKLGELTQ